MIDREGEEMKERKREGSNGEWEREVGVRVRKREKL